LLVPVEAGDTLTRRTLLVLLQFELASVAATLVDLGIFSLAVHLGTSPVVATPIGALGGAVTNFLLNRHVTFRAQGGGVSRQALRYLAVSACSLGLNTLVAMRASRNCRRHTP